MSLEAMPRWARWLVDGDEFPPAGRTRVPFDEAQRVLVDHPTFAGSSTRSLIWQGLERYLARFFDLQDQYEQELQGRDLVHYLWMGGSFVSNHLDPRNLDLSVVYDAEARDLIKGRRGSAWLVEAFSRDSIAQYRLSPLAVPYRAIASPFQSHALSEAEQSYLRERGAWDDWWQRCRAQGVAYRGPTVHTVGTARGYLEVTL
jgi:hypothetical protein